MTQEQYNRAVEIHTQIEELTSANRELEEDDDILLSFVYLSKTDNDFFDTNRSVCKILSRHYWMIRAEINEEIEKLKKEIEEL